MVKELFQVILFSPENKKVDRLCMKCSPTLKKSVESCTLILYFKINTPFFYCPLFWGTSQPTGQINRRMFKLFFFTKNSIKADRFCMKFSPTRNKSEQSCLNPYFKISIPFFYFPSFEEYLNSWIRSTVNKHRVDYQPILQG